MQEAERTDAMHPVAGHLPSGKQASTESATVTWEQALSHAPSVLGKLVMVSKCRLDSDDYEHEALKHVPAEIAAAVMRASHMDLFTRWLALSFEEKLKDLVEYLEAVSDPKARKPLLKEDWQRLIPPSAAQAERLLFESDVAVVLELSEE